MTRPPAVVVHGFGDARLALSAGLPVTLLSGAGAALYAGCLWWRELVAAARRDYPAAAAFGDILDCADATGRATAALRIGQKAIVLLPEAPGFASVAAIAAGLGAEVLTARPPALDLGQPRAERELRAWLRARVTDRPPWARTRRTAEP
jgi:hypothetical protein